MTGSPTVSVVIPVFNTERFVRQALESVFSQKGNPALLEVIVVDDGSTDRSRDVVREFADRITLIEQPHAGIGAARNRGVDAATGEFIAFLDADDLWAPAKLAIQLPVLLAPGAPDFVSGMVEQFRDGPAGTRQRVGELAPGYIAGAMLMRREVFNSVGPFATDVRAGEFIDWYARATDLGLTCRVLQDVVLHRRLHDANTARTSGDNNQDVVSVVRAAMLRRRGQA